MGSKARFVALLAFGITTRLLAADRSEAFAVHQGLVYSVVERELTLDLFLPSKVSALVPCVLVIQGGGFRPQDGQRFRPFAVHLAENGFAAALISYRGIPKHQYPDTLADAKAAVRFVRKISAQHGIDPNRIGATGRSAGATLAALLAVTGDMKQFEGEGGHAGFSSRIQAAVCFSGVFDFIARFTDPQQIALQPMLDAKLASNGQWIGPPFSPTNQRWLDASAINHVDRTDPPVLFVHCKNDATVPWQQSQEMHARMNRSGTAPSLKYYETGGHGYGGLGKAPMDEMVRFFRKSL